MAKTFLDNLEEHIFSKVNNEEELIALLNKGGADQKKNTKRTSLLHNIQSKRKLAINKNAKRWWYFKNKRYR